jgi:plastocyanin
MTYLLPICFSLAAVTLSGAALQGKVELTDAKKKGSAEGVVAWLEPVGGVAAVPGAARFVLDQRNKKFLPHVMAIPVGSQVDFPNRDPIFHNAFSNFAGQPFDTGLYAPGTSQKIIFRRPGVVRVFCNIHAQMSAVIVVVPSPYFATSGTSGIFRIENVPAGEYVLKVFHERATENTLAALERRVTVTGDQDLGGVKISETGYLELGHKNKHGGEYPATPAENGPYIGKK